VTRDALHFRRFEQALEGPQRRGLAADFHARIHVAEIARIDARGEIVLVVGEQLVARAFVQPREAQAGVALLAARHVQRETLHGQALLPAAQMIQPDQPEGEQAGGIAFRRRAYGRPAGLPAAQKRARIAGRKAGFQVRLGADLGQRPIRELARQELPESLAKDQALAAALEIQAGGPRQVHQEQAALFAGELLDHQFQPAARFVGHAGHAPHQVARLVPHLEREPRAAQLQREVVRRQRQQRLAGFQQSGPARRFEKALDRGLRVRGNDSQATRMSGFGAPEFSVQSFMYRAPAAFVMRFWT
jgi:hypothetical protein